MTLVRLPDDEDWLMRPVLAQLVKLESLFDGTVDLEQIALANDALDVAAENERRIAKARENAP